MLLNPLEIQLITLSSEITTVYIIDRDNFIYELYINEEEMCTMGEMQYIFHIQC